MAVLNTKNGKRLAFSLKDGSRRWVRLGQVNMAAGREVEKHIKHIVRCQRTGEEPRKETQEWILRIREDWPELADRLNTLGVFGNGRIKDPVLVEFVERYIESRNDAKPATIKVWKQMLAYIKRYLAGRTLCSLTKADGNAYLRSLKSHQMTNGKTLAKASAGKYFSFTRQFLNEAVDAELIVKNPFTGIVAPRKINKSRQCLVDHATVDLVINAAPDAEMQLIIALSRYGGLRTPSETFALKWQHIDWIRRRMTVTSPKTERYEGHETREMPLFPELMPHLLKCRDLAPVDAVYVIARRRLQSEANLRGRMTGILKRANVERWPKVFHNLRASLQTELEQRGFPTHVVCAWLGNSPKVAKEHYLQVSDADFERASGVATKVATQDQETPRNASQTAENANGQKTEKPLVLQDKTHFRLKKREWMGIEPDSATNDLDSVYVESDKDATQNPTQFAVLHSLLFNKGFADILVGHFPLEVFALGLGRRTRDAFLA